jgi:hypothetical protein
MSTRPGTLTADDLTDRDLTVSAPDQVFAALVHDCELLPTGWGPDGVGHPTARYSEPVPMDEVVTRIRALGDVGEYDR